MATTTYAGVDQRTNTFAARNMLRHAQPVIVLAKFGLPKPMPKHRAKSVEFRRPIPFAAIPASQTLTEGTPPTPIALTYEDVSATLVQYGNTVEITDVTDDLVEDPVFRDATELSGEQAAEVTEAVIWGEVKGGTNVVYANGTARNQVNSVLGLDHIRNAVRTLRANRGRPITKVLDGSPNYNTVPVEGGYVVVGHTDVEADIRTLPGFIPVAEYGSRKPLCPEELGTVESTRFVLSPMLDAFADAGGTAATNGTLSTTGTNSDVYPLIVFARDAFGLVALKGMNAITPSVILPGQVDKSDPLGQIGYVGWKTYFAAKRLNETWMVRIEVAASDLA